MMRIPEYCMRLDVVYGGTEISRNSASSDLLCRKKCLKTPQAQFPMRALELSIVLIILFLVIQRNPSNAGDN